MEKPAFHPMCRCYEHRILFLAMSTICILTDGPAAGEQLSYEKPPTQIDHPYPAKSRLTQVDRIKTIMYYLDRPGREKNTFLFTCHLKRTIAE